MHYYVSIPALSHKVFKHAGYHSLDNDANNQWHQENGILGSDEEVAAGPYRVLCTVEYLGDRIHEDLQPYGEGDTIICDMWVRRSFPGDDERYRIRALSFGGMLHTFRVEETEATSKAIAQHIEIELARKGLEDRIAKWRQTMRLENWSTTGSDDPYQPPEHQTRRLQGNVYNHPRFNDGRSIRTSSIVSIDGGTVTTKNSVYTLGEPDPRFVEWCRENGHHVPTPEEPIKV